MMADEVNVNWTNFKTLADSKGFGMQYVDTGDNYLIWFVEDTIKYTTVITKTTPAGTDQDDFEDNYKTGANKPVFIGEDEVIHVYALRDTSDHLTNISDNRGAIPKTVVIYNDTNQSITCQLQGDRDTDFDFAMDMGDTFEVVSNTHDYATVSDYLPYLKVKFKATNTAPTTGTVSIYIMRVKV